MSSTSWKISFLSAAIAGLALASCGHPNSGTSGSGGSTGGCTAGTEYCSCLSGKTCNAGLRCADDLNECVAIGTGGSTGTGGSSSTGGSTGTGGSVSTGGSTGTGGSSATGGSTGTGGSSSTGGSSATGGSTGSGGSSSTGGSTGTGGVAGPNLVMNGDVSQGTNGWNVGQGSPTTSGVVNGQYCATISSGSGTVLIGWGSASISANLMPNVNYTLSYQASTSGALSSFDVHVGSAVSVGGSYPVDEDYAQDSPGTGNLTTVTHSFTLTSADPQAGVAFIFAASSGTPTVCIDNLAITQN